MKDLARMENIFPEHEQRKDLFHSLLKEDGTILCANAKMIDSFQLKDQREDKTNFFGLVHPANLAPLRKVLDNCEEKGKSCSAEIYLKNGQYHLMKWQISCLQDKSGPQRQYFCTGYLLERQENAEKSGHNSGRNYRHSADGNDEGVVFLDGNCELVFGNHKLAEMFDKTLPELYQVEKLNVLWDKDWLITSEKGDRIFFEDSPFKKALRNGRIYETTLSVKTRSAGLKKVKFSAQPLFGEKNDKPYGVVSCITDITSRSVMPASFLEEDIFFNEFMKHTPNLAWVTDENASLMVASHSFYDFFSLDGQKATGKKIRDIVPADIARPMLEKHLAVLNTGKASDTTEKIIWPDGTKLTFHINIFPIAGRTGKKMLGGHAVAIPEKHSVEKQLREANARLILMSKATSDAIWEWDMLTGQIFRNDTLMSMIGYHSEEPKGLKWWFRRIHQEDRNRVIDKVRESMEQGRQSWEEEYRFKCADGVHRYMHDKGYIVYENGLPVKMIGSLQDLTDLKRLETELTKEKFRHQKEISETVIRVQEKERTRIGNELHDNVNQILSTTKLFVDILTVNSDDEKLLKAKSIEYLLLAIEEIRKLSRELVSPQLQKKTLTESINYLVSDIRLSAKMQIKFTFSPDVELLSIGKKVTLFRIVQEQMKNVLKYSEATSTEILLTSKETMVSLSIRDNGIGFDTDRPVKGIGLYNIRERVKFYNGEVKLDSAPGKGCLLQVQIPLQDPTTF